MTHRTVSVDLGDRSYDIHIGPTVLSEAGALMRSVLNRPNAIIVTDETVAPLHLETLTTSLRAADIARALTELGGDCPPEALQAGSNYRPKWVDDGP